MLNQLECLGLIAYKRLLIKKLSVLANLLAVSESIRLIKKFRIIAKKNRFGYFCTIYSVIECGSTVTDVRSVTANGNNVVSPEYSVTTWSVTAET